MIQYQILHTDEILGVHERVNFNCWPSPLCVIVHLCVTWTPNDNEKKSQTTHLCIKKYLIFHQKWVATKQTGKFLLIKDSITEI